MRLKSKYSTLLPLVTVIIVLWLILTRHTDKHATNSQPQPPTKHGQHSDNVISNAAMFDGDNFLSANLVGQQQKLQAVYDGPFPDSCVPEGVQLELMDYHNSTKQALDKARVGRGEQGASASFPKGMESEQENPNNWFNGFNGLLSDYIALDRALPDLRHPACVSLAYFKHLPSVSVVVPVFEEWLSVLQRLVTSLLNRTPAHLLKEIILVDDGSTVRKDLVAPLDEWLVKNAPIARVVRLPKRGGLITARLAGAKEASGDVLVILDSHMEVTNNWLPPLLNPIVEKYNTVVLPIIDALGADDYKYFAWNNGSRGGFDWWFCRISMPLPSETEKLLPQPFPNPVMQGGAFAISRQFFWELGGYDPGLQFWGGEQYELSFKTWMCGGRMLEAPCSRVGHLGKTRAGNLTNMEGENLIEKNYKRVALVWMDEYMAALTRRINSLEKVDAGDVTNQLAVRERLHCKSFRWYLENVAPDTLEYYPPDEPENFAEGPIRNVFYNTCVEKGSVRDGAIRLSHCHDSWNMRLTWSWRGSIRTYNDHDCLDLGLGKTIIFYLCHNIIPAPHQKWKYNPLKKQLQGGQSNLCLEAMSEEEVFMAPCEENNTKQQWQFKTVNIDRIKEVYPEIE